MVVYFHRNPNDGQIFYVGIGTKDRAYRLIPSQRNFRWNRYVNKYGKPIVQILLSDLKYHEACEKEKYYIALLGRRGYEKDGCLTNLSLGGESTTSGIKLSETHKHKLSIALKGRKKTEEHKMKLREANIGKHPMTEAKLIASSKLRGRKLTEEHKMKVGEASRSHWLQKDFRNKCTSALLGGPGRCKKEVVDLSNGASYVSAKEAWRANNLKICLSYFQGMLKGRWPNKTSFEYKCNAYPY